MLAHLHTSNYHVQRKLMAYVSLSKHFNHPYPSPIKALAPLGITKTNCDFSQSLKYFNSVTQDIVQ